MVVNESMYQLGSVRSAIRELFEYGKKRAAIVGKENVYDFSIGNPSIPAPQIVNDTIKELVTDYDSVALHGYTSAQGDVETRAAIAEFLNNTHGTHFNADNLYMTMGAAASLSMPESRLTPSMWAFSCYHPTDFRWDSCIIYSCTALLGILQDRPILMAFIFPDFKSL